MNAGIGRPLQGDRLFGPEMHEDPYPVYHELRASDPVHRDESLGAWVLTRHDDVSLVLNDPRFSSDRVSLARERFRDEDLRPLFDVLRHLMVHRDSPDHDRLRALVHGAFVRTTVEHWEPTIRRRIDSLLAGPIAKGHMDFVWDFAVPLPLLIIFEIVGIPEEDRDQVKAWCDDFSVVELNFYAHITREQLEQGLRSTLAFREYLREKVDGLRNSPHHDLLSSLVQAEEGGTSLTLDELLGNALLLLNAGNETTTCLLGNGLAALLRNPEQLALLREDPSRIPDAVEEFLRYDSPVQFLGRVAAEDVELRGKTIRKGDMVLVVLAAANRDPERFPDPDRLDVTRRDNHHVAFGHGHHFCVGAQLARLEARLAFTTLLSRLRVLELETTDLSHRSNFNMRSFQNLPLRVAT
jgi:cytochrome P450